MDSLHPKAVPRRRCVWATSPNHEPGGDDGGGSKTTAPSKNNRDFPIVGLGCSSFSDFFLGPDELDQFSQKLANPPQRDHPLVERWVNTIRHAVLDRGINLLDTAPWYGHGSSETVIGYAMDSLLQNEDDKDKKEEEGGGDGRQIRREEIIINTKVGRYDADPTKMFDFSARRVRESVVTSLERMKCGYIDVLQIHDPEFAPSHDLLVDVTIPAMARMREEGLCRAIGMTGYPLETQRELIRRSYDEHGIRFDQSLTYCHYNLHDQSLFRAPPPAGDDDDEGGASSSSSFAAFCREGGIVLITAAPLSMGLLTPAGPPDWHPASDSLKSACRKAASICNEEGVNIASLATLFALGNTDIPCTIIGIKDESEVDRAADAACRFHGGKGGGLNDVLDEAEKRVLEKLLDRRDGPFAKLSYANEEEWDGCEEADKFWSQIPGGKTTAEKTMRT